MGSSLSVKVAYAIAIPEWVDDIEERIKDLLGPPRVPEPKDPPYAEVRDRPARERPADWQAWLDAINARSAAFRESGCAVAFGGAHEEYQCYLVMAASVQDGDWYGQPLDVAALEQVPEWWRERLYALGVGLGVLDPEPAWHLFGNWG